MFLLFFFIFEKKNYSFIGSRLQRAVTFVKISSELVLAVTLLFLLLLADLQSCEKEVPGHGINRGRKEKLNRNFFFDTGGSATWSKPRYHTVSPHTGVHRQVLQRKNVGNRTKENRFHLEPRSSQKVQTRNWYIWSHKRKNKLAMCAALPFLLKHCICKVICAVKF